MQLTMSATEIWGKVVYKYSSFIIISFTFLSFINLCNLTAITFISYQNNKSGCAVFILKNTNYQRKKDLIF
jgi:hypothetical protein